MATTYANHFDALSQIDFSNDEPARLEALKSAQQLVHSLQKPWERMYDWVWSEPFLLASTKIAKDIDLFSHLSASPRTTADLAVATGTDAALLKRILRVLATGHVIYEAQGEDEYVDGPFSSALKDPKGLIKGLDVFFHAGGMDVLRLPEYFVKHGYINPVKRSEAPWKWLQGVASYEGDRWEFLNVECPEKGRHFSAFLAQLRGEQVPWTEQYPIAKLLEGWTEGTALLVDVGGGKGRDVRYVAEALDGMGLGGAGLVLQDKRSVLETVDELPERVERMPHDFFTKQPVVGAKIYFLRSVLHDWPDVEAVDILTKLMDAMTPNYSRILLHETILPARASNMRLMQAAMDVNMMCNYAALERTEAQWKLLAERAGLRFSGVVLFPGTGQGVMELEL